MKNNPPFTLTEKDEEILNLRRSGLTLKEIASRVFMHQRVVERRLEALRRKASVKNDIELISYCHVNGLFTPLSRE